MKRARTVSELGLLLTQSDNTKQKGDELRIGQATRVAKLTCQQIARHGFSQAKLTLPDVIWNDEKAKIHNYQHCEDVGNIMFDEVLVGKNNFLTPFFWDLRRLIRKERISK